VSAHPAAAALNQDQQYNHETDACDDPNQRNVVHFVAPFFD